MPRPKSDSEVGHYEAELAAVTKKLEEARSREKAPGPFRVASLGDSVGGLVEVLAYGVPVGLGSHVHWDRKIDGLRRAHDR